MGLPSTFGSKLGDLFARCTTEDTIDWSPGWVAERFKHLCTDVRARDSDDERATRCFQGYNCGCV